MKSCLLLISLLRLDGELCGGLRDVMERNMKRWCMQGRANAGKAKVLVSRVFHLVGKSGC